MDARRKQRHHRPPKPTHETISSGKDRAMQRFIFLFVSFIIALTAPVLHAAELAKPSRQINVLPEILILNSYHPGYAFSDDEQAGVVDVLRAKDKTWVPVIEYLDLKRLPDGKHLAELKKLFRQKYQNKKFSVVIAMDNPALEFAIDNRAELFGNAPIVFCGINNYNPSLLKGRTDVTGIVEAIDIAGTIEVMLRLHPETQEIFSPHDYTATGLAVRKELEALVPRFGAKIRFRFTDPLTMEELLKELERLSRNSLVLEIGFITDKSGRTFGISETTKLFYEHSPVPIYSTYEQRLGFGIVGGKLLSPRIHGANAARVALRVLAGEKASTIPIVYESDSQFMFDDKVMSRFGIPLSALPEGSAVINKPLSFYAAHRIVILTALGIIGFLSIVISLLAINMIQRKRSIEVIRVKDERFKVITSSNPDHILLQDNELRYSFVLNPQMGLTEQDMIGKTDHDFLSKEDADKLAEIKRQVLNTGRAAHVEVPLTSSTGEQQFFTGSYIPKLDAKNQIDGLIGYFRNITEQKQVESRLRESEEWHRSILQTAMDGFWCVDLQGRLLEVNETYCRMSGYSVQKLLTMSTADLEAFETGTDTAAHIRKVMKQGEDRFESRHRRKDGTIFDVEVSVQYKPLQGGRLVVFLRDITDRKRTEEIIRKSEDKFSKSFHSSPILTAISTIKEGRFLDVNEIFIQTLLFSREEVIGKTSSELGFFANPVQRQTIRKITEEKGYARNIETQIVAKNGQIIDGLFSAEPITINNERCWLTVMVNVSEHKRAEEALRESEEKFRNYIESAPDGVLITDETGRLIEMNNSSCRLTGYSKEEIVKISIRDLLAEESMEDGLAHFRKAMETGAATADLWHNHKDGSKRCLTVDAVKLSETRIIGFTKDITDRKRSEEDHRQLQERLQRAEKMEALGTLAGGVAHDLNNVLGIVVGYSEMLLDEIDAASPLRDDMVKIMEGGHRSAAIVQDLLTLARRGVHARNVFNLNDAVRDCRKTPEFEKALSLNPKVSIKTDLEADLLNMMGSPLHIGKTIMNLVSNAIEAMPYGGLLTVATSNRSLDMPVQGYDAVNAGDYVVLTIADTGEGISASDIKHIFEPFYTKKVMGKSGTGLGLAVVWGTVKDHHGYIDVRSEVGKGTTFTLYFPVTREEMAEAGTTIPLSDYIGHEESILVIDDIKEQRELAAKMLGKLNYKVKTVSSGEEAVAYLRDEKADLIVLDMIMDPGMDGLDTYKAVLEIHPKQKAIIVSGFSETDRVKEARAIGAGDYIKKPYVQEKLGLAVRKELDRK
jgi:PAS domain S-box-containing protein